MTAVRRWLGVKYSISRGLWLYFVVVAVSVQLAWPAFANSWQGSFIVVGASVAAAVIFQLAVRIARRKQAACPNRSTAAHTSNS